MLAQIMLIVNHKRSTYVCRAGILHHLIDWPDIIQCYGFYHKFSDFGFHIRILMIENIRTVLNLDD